MKLQKKENKFIGEILTDLGFVSEKDIVAALSSQWHFPYISINQYEIKKEVLNVISGETAFRDKVVPLDCVGNILSVVMSNPLEVSITQKLKEVTNCEIVPFISTRMEIDQALNNFYGENKN